MLSGEGLRLDTIANKQDFLLDIGDGLILSGVANVDIDNEEALIILLDRDGYVYFTLLKSNVSVLFPEGKLDRSVWMEFVWKNNGVVFLPMGYMDEESCEIVAMGHNHNILPLIYPS